MISSVAAVNAATTAISVPNINTSTNIEFWNIERVTKGVYETFTTVSEFIDNGIGFLPDFLTVACGIFMTLYLARFMLRLGN